MNDREELGRMARCGHGRQRKISKHRVICLDCRQSRAPGGRFGSMEVGRCVAPDLFSDCLIRDQNAETRR